MRFHIPHYAVKNLLGGKNKYQGSSTIEPNMTPVPAEVWRLSEGESGHTGVLGEVRGLPFPKHFIMLWLEFKDPQDIMGGGQSYEVLFSCASTIRFF